MKVPCPKCSAEADVKAATAVGACAFCGSALYIDYAGAILHMVLQPVIKVKNARKLLHLQDHRASAEVVYHPFWFFDRGAVGKMAPADSLLKEDLEESAALAGNERSFSADKEAAKKGLPPNIPLNAVLDEDEQEGARPRLVQVPFYRFSTPSGELSIDAVEGRLLLHSNEERSGSEPWMRPAAIALTLLFFAAFLPSGIAASVVLFTVIAGIAFPVLFHLATRKGREMKGRV